MRLGKLTLSCAAVLILPSFGASQNPSAPAAPTIHVYSRETIIDVLVTDDKGGDVSDVFYLRYIVLHCSSSAADSAGEGEQGVYNYQHADQVVLGNDTRSR